MLVYDSYSRGFVCSSWQGYVAPTHKELGLMLTKFLWITDGAGAVDVYALSRDIKSLLASAKTDRNREKGWERARAIIYDR